MGNSSSQPNAEPANVSGQAAPEPDSTIGRPTELQESRQEDIPQHTRDPEEDELSEYQHPHIVPQLFNMDVGTPDAMPADEETKAQRRRAKREKKKRQKEKRESQASHVDNILHRVKDAPIGQPVYHQVHENRGTQMAERAQFEKDSPDTHREKRKRKQPADATLFPGDNVHEGSQHIPSMDSPSFKKRRKEKVTHNPRPEVEVPEVRQGSVPRNVWTAINRPKPARGEPRVETQLLADHSAPTDTIIRERRRPMSDKFVSSDTESDYSAPNTPPPGSDEEDSMEVQEKATIDLPRWRVESGQTESSALPTSERMETEPEDADVRHAIAEQAEDIAARRARNMERADSSSKVVPTRTPTFAEALNKSLQPDDSEHSEEDGSQSDATDKIPTRINGHNAGRTRSSVVDPSDDHSENSGPGTNINLWEHTQRQIEVEDFEGSHHDSRVQESLALNATSKQIHTNGANDGANDDRDPEPFDEAFVSPSRKKTRLPDYGDKSSSKNSKRSPPRSSKAAKALTDLTEESAPAVKAKSKSKGKPTSKSTSTSKGRTGSTQSSISNARSTPKVKSSRRTSNTGGSLDSSDEGDAGSLVEQVNGPFSSDEYDIICSFRDRWCDKHSKNKLQFNELCHANARNNPTVQKFWTSIRKRLPHRNGKALQKFCRRKFHNFEKRGTWEDDEDMELKKLVFKYGFVWVKIGQEMDRHHEDVRDRYRNYIAGAEDRETHKWSNLDVVALRKAIGNCIIRVMKNEAEDDDEFYSGAYLRHNIHNVTSTKQYISWKAVSSAMNGRRSRIQCRYKWNQLVEAGKTDLRQEVEAAWDRLARAIIQDEEPEVFRDTTEIPRSTDNNPDDSESGSGSSSDSLIMSKPRKKSQPKHSQVSSGLAKSKTKGNTGKRHTSRNRYLSSCKVESSSGEEEEQEVARQETGQEIVDDRTEKGQVLFTGAGERKGGKEQAPQASSPLHTRKPLERQSLAREETISDENSDDLMERLRSTISSTQEEQQQRRKSNSTT